MSTNTTAMLYEYCHMSWYQTVVNTNNPAGIGTLQRSHNIMHCISLDRLYSLVRARRSSKFTYAKHCREKLVGQGHSSALFPAAMYTCRKFRALSRDQCIAAVKKNSFVLTALCLDITSCGVHRCIGVKCVRGRTILCCI